MTCIFEGKPLPAVTWLQAGNVISEDPNKYEITEDNVSDTRTLSSVTDGERDRELMMSHLHTSAVRERLRAVPSPPQGPEKEAAERKHTPGPQRERCAHWVYERRVLSAL